MKAATGFRLGEERGLRVIQLAGKGRAIRVIPAWVSHSSSRNSPASFTKTLAAVVVGAGLAIAMQS